MFAALSLSFRLIDLSIDIWNIIKINDCFLYFNMVKFVKPLFVHVLSFNKAFGLRLKFSDLALIQIETFYRYKVIGNFKKRIISEYSFKNYIKLCTCWLNCSVRHLFWANNFYIHLLWLNIAAEGKTLIIFFTLYQNVVGDLCNFQYTMYLWQWRRTLYVVIICSSLKLSTF